ncbi:unnamed protein product [Rangifer tarandus platyrhynchus]|uniref:Uncharacterized protein n=1 Tax=Rangifer tarandus platyrhynchus TaxID=3082113 RepID=A0AC59YAP3_RANTA
MSLELFHQKERGGVAIKAKLNKRRETAVRPGQEEKESVVRAQMFLKMLFARARSRAICRRRSARVPLKNSGSPPPCLLRPTRINTADGEGVKEESHSAIFSFPLKSYISRFKFVFIVLFQPK